MIHPGDIRKLVLLIVCAFLMGNNLWAQKLLDSIVRFEYFTEFDSLRWTKDAYEYSTKGIQTSHSYYCWDKVHNDWAGSPFDIEESTSNIGRVDNTYDEAGNLVTWGTFSWDRTGWKWLPQYKGNHVHDIDGKDICQNAYRWDATLDVWVEESGSEYNYDDAGRLTSLTKYLRDTILNSWQPSEKEEYAYNLAGKTVLHLYFKWDNNQRDWISNRKYEYDYDSTGREIRHISYRMLSSNWIPDSKTEKKYDSFGNCILDGFYSWSVSLGIWVLNYKTEAQADSTGLVVTEFFTINEGSRTRYENEYNINRQKSARTMYRWYPVQKKWFEDMRWEWIYDSSGNLLSDTQFHWDFSLNKFVGDNRTENRFDASGNKIYEASLQQRSLAIGWIAYIKTEWAYDASGNKILEMHFDNFNLNFEDWNGEYKLETQYDSDGNILLEILSSWDFNQKEFILCGKFFHYYHESITGIPMVESDHIIVYPNPTGGLVYFRNPTKPVRVKVYSIQGILLRSMKNVEGSVDLSNMPPGTYLIMVAEGNGPTYRTILIKE